jgi:hypothetical protein
MSLNLNGSPVVASGAVMIPPGVESASLTIQGVEIPIHFEPTAPFGVRYEDSSIIFSGDLRAGIGVRFLGFLFDNLQHTLAFVAQAIGPFEPSYIVHYTFYRT